MRYEASPTQFPRAADPTLGMIMGTRRPPSGLQVLLALALVNLLGAQVSCWETGLHLDRLSDPLYAQLQRRYQFAPIPSLKPVSKKKYHTEPGPQYDIKTTSPDDVKISFADLANPSPSLSSKLDRLGLAHHRPNLSAASTSSSASASAPSLAHKNWLLGVLLALKKRGYHVKEFDHSNAAWEKWAAANGKGGQPAVGDFKARSGRGGDRAGPIRGSDEVMIKPLSRLPVRYLRVY